MPQIARAVSRVRAWLVWRLFVVRVALTLPRLYGCHLLEEAATVLTLLNLNGFLEEAATVRTVVGRAV